MALHDETLNDSTILDSTHSSDSNRWDSDFGNVNVLEKIVHNLIYYVRETWNHTTLDSVYPVGSIYMSVNSTNPGVLFGGNWSRIENQFLVAAGDEFPAGGHGGHEYVTLDSSNLPRHNHNVSLRPDGLSGSSSGAYFHGGTTYDSSVSPVTGYTSYSGSSSPEPISTLPPFLSVNMWKRVS